MALYTFSAPSLRPVEGMDKRIRRHMGLAMAGLSGENHMGEFALRRFFPRIYGLEGFGRKKVLEIGGTEEISMRRFFSRIGADYTCVRLEGPERPDVIVGDFMDVRGEFDLVISLGVFELGALDIDFANSRSISGNRPLDARIKKLGSLARGGGFVVIGTINAPCLFSDRMLRSAGFALLHREGPFYSFMFPGNKDAYAPDDRSELLVLRRP
jgi:hypothetical protein